MIIPFCYVLDNNYNTDNKLNLEMISLKNLNEI